MACPRGGCALYARGSVGRLCWHVMRNTRFVLEPNNAMGSSRSNCIHWPAMNADRGMEAVSYTRPNAGTENTAPRFLTTLLLLTASKYMQARRQYDSMKRLSAVHTRSTTQRTRSKVNRKTTGVGDRRIDDLQEQAINQESICVSVGPIWKSKLFS
jgi:hypothetical protein